MDSAREVEKFGDDEGEKSVEENEQGREEQWLQWGKGRRTEGRKKQ